MGEAHPAALQAVHVHGGDWRRTTRELGLRRCPPLRRDFSVNLNPLGAPPAVAALLRGGSVAWDRYPEPFADAAAASLAAAHDLPPAQVLLDNGSTALFALALRVLKPGRVAWIEPSYGGYAEAVEAMAMQGGPLAAAREEEDFSIRPETLPLQGVGLLFLASPNNPTGRIVDPDGVRAAARRNPGTWFVLDESYADFLPGNASLMGADMPANLIVIKSLTKFFSLPGLRLGLLAAPPALAATLRRGLLPWSVNAAATAAAPQLYADRTFLEESRRRVEEWRESLARGLAELAGVRVFPSAANFLYVKLPSRCPARKLQRRLLEAGLMIRTYGEPPWRRFCRIAVRRPEENRELLRVMEQALGDGASSHG